MTYPQQPGQPDQQPPYGAPGPESQQWTAQSGAAPGYGPPAGSPQPGSPQPGSPQPGPYGPGFGPAPVGGPSFFSRLPRPALMALASAVAGVITFFMGFLGWITISQNIENKVDTWAEDVGDSLSIPAYLTPSLVLSPGWFFLLLGAIAVASAGLVAPKLQRFLPYLAFGSVVGWLGLFVCALGMPPFVSLGAGAYVALILGFVQTALLVGAAIMDGMDPAPPASIPPAPQQWQQPGPGLPPHPGR